MGGLKFNVWEVTDNASGAIKFTYLQLKDVSKNILKQDVFDLRSTVNFLLDRLGVKDGCKICIER